MASMALVCAGCAPSPGVLARVGDAEIPVQELQLYLESAAGESWQSVDDRVATRLLDQYLDQEVVLQAASDAKSHADVVDPAARTASVRALLQRLCGEATSPVTVAIETEVERRLGETRGRRARVRQLLLPDRAAAETARQRLVDGEPFGEVSRQVSRAPNAATGGVLGLLEEGTLPPQIDAVVFSLGVDEVSQPVRSPAGYHVFQVLEVVPAGVPRRAEVEARVRDEYTVRASGEHTRACLDRLATMVVVRVYADHLWFNYDGRYSGSENAH